MSLAEKFHRIGSGSLFVKESNDKQPINNKGKKRFTEYMVVNSSGQR